MRRLILFFMLILLMALLASCSSGETNGDKDNGDDGKQEIDQTIKIPTSESFGRDVINFGMISYKRPDVKVLEENLSSLTKMIEEAEASFDTQMASLRPTLKALSTFLTAYTYVSIKHSSNTRDSYYKTEYEHLSKEYQSITESAEALYTAAASSPYAVRFEEEYFGEGFIEKYAEASKVTDNLSLLIDNERRLEEIYSKISPSTVHITCDGIYGSYDAVMRALESKYADSPEMLTVQRALAESLYKEQRRITAMDTFLTLVKVRRLIAEELGYESYTHYAYSNLNHGYTPEQYKKFIDDTVKYAVPVYRKLHNQVFNSYFKNNSPSEILAAYTVNILSDVYKQMSEDIYGVYAYMLYYGMFDIKPSASTRKDGSFTVYLEEYDSPYLFLSASSNMEDFLTLSGSFGIFCDKFINNNSSGSVDITEASSIGMQLLTLIGLGDHVTEKDYRYLLYFEIERLLGGLIENSFFASLEHRIYELSYSEITEERVDSIISELLRDTYLADGVTTDIYSLLSSDIICEPLMIQSHTTATAVALEIFFAETQKSGEGVKRYLAMIQREGETDLTTQLFGAGIASPFETEIIKDIANKIHYTILGSYFFGVDGGGIIAGLPEPVYQRDEELAA